MIIEHGSEASFSISELLLCQNKFLIIAIAFMGLLFVLPEINFD